MGCFAVLKAKKKKSDQIILPKRPNHNDHVPVPLPEPQTQTHSGQFSSSSFRSRGKLVHPLVTSNRIRALSAPSALDAAEQDALASVECLERDELKHQSRSMKEHHSSTPQPLPLPCPPGSSALKASRGCKSGPDRGSFYACEPLPLPPTGSPRYFLYEEIAAACHNFSSDRFMSECLSSTIYKASFGDDTSSSKKFEATVTCLHPSTHGLREFINEVDTLASLQHQNICRLLGFHAPDTAELRMLVYERLYHGSLDCLLFGKSAGPALDWNSRMKIAICAAQGLAFLHDEGPFQAMYYEFSTANIQVDKDFSAKLSGYGCVGRILEEAVGSISAETLERGVLTPKSNVWSFGIILLELLTGRKNLDSRHPNEERNLVKWSWPFLADEFRLSMIMDTQLKGRYPPKAARMLADIAQRCLQKEPSIRPAMRTVVKHLKMIQDMKYSCRFPLQEPAACSAKQMSKGLDGVTSHAPKLSFSPSSPPRAKLHGPSPKWPTVPLALPPRPCSSTLSMEELVRHGGKKSPSSAATRKASVEGW